jgi:hypothetical protein
VAPLIEGRRAVAFVLALGLVVAAASLAALVAGVEEARLALAGARRDLAAEELASAGSGWFAVFGCVRHDWAVGVRPGGSVYRLGSAAPSEGDRVFTPLAAAGACDEGSAPPRVLALVEDDDTIATTVGHDYRVAVPPPPVAALVDGVVGYASAHGGAAAHARGLLATVGLPAASAPLLVKGRHPGVLWVALVTAGLGAHGLLLIGLVVWWAVRRRRYAEDPEAQFFAALAPFHDDQE